MLKATLSAIGIAILASSGAQAANITLYDQDFESPMGFVNGSGSGYSDLSQQSVNSLYGGQPAGFSFAQSFTVETMLLTGSTAFGTGYNDLTGQGGNYAIGMLSTAQDDRLGLSFDVGTFDFFNFRIDISAVGLHGGPGAPFGSETVAPEFRFTLYDNPTGANTIGSGTVLDTATMTGTTSALDTLDWTRDVFAFDTSSSTNGKVTLQIDLLSGGYAVFDNFLITASDDAGGGIPDVPLPGSLAFLGLGMGAIGWMRRKGRH